MNALRHGLAAKTIVIPGENAGEFEELHSEFISAWDPVDAIEADLVGQLAISAWNMRRVSRIEAKKFHDKFEDEESAWKSLDNAKDKDLGTRHEALMATSRDFFPYFDKLIKYGTTYERRYYRALHTLIQLRSARAISQTLSITTD
jgi:hypothetical protein